MNEAYLLQRIPSEAGGVSLRDARRFSHCLGPLLSAILAVGVAGCTSTPPQPTFPNESTPTVHPKPVEAAPPPPKRGAYYLDDGPGENPPANLDSIPDAVPKAEPLRPAANRPYEVFGKPYTPLTVIKPYREKGIASWYGRRYHGKPTSSGEVYDMYAMTAAHPTLPIPSYVRVTNLKTNLAVVVRINDRGPFLHDRVIDLSYAAAYKIGTLAGGSGVVEVELIVPGRETTGKSYAALANQGADPQKTAAAASAATPKFRELPPPPLASPSKGDAPPKSAPGVAGTASQGNSSPEQAILKETTASGSYFLQLGAFSGKDNADGFIARLKGIASELTDNLDVLARDGLYRVQSGPYASDADARSAANRLASRLGVKVIVITR